MIPLRAAGLLLLICVAAKAAETKTYEVLLKDVPGARGGSERILELVFYQNPPQLR